MSYLNFIGIITDMRSSNLSDMLDELAETLPIGGAESPRGILERIADFVRITTATAEQLVAAVSRDLDKAIEQSDTLSPADADPIRKELQAFLEAASIRA